MLILKDQNPSRNLTDDESSGVCPAELESMCTAPRMLVHFAFLCDTVSVPTLWIGCDAPASRPILLPQTML